MKIAAVLLLLAQSVLGLHYYLDAGERKCFSEDLPAGTSIVGAFKSELWNTNINGFAENSQANVQISVFAAPTEHTIIDQKGGSKGKFSFTAADAGDHQICLSVTTPGWFGARAKMYLDIQFADSEPSERDDSKQTSYTELMRRISDLTNRVQHIRNEMKHQRDREAEFRDHSEVVNTSAVRWTIVQMVVLGITCFWQLRHLKQFFLTKKLV
ncbi:emp24p/erv25p-related protein [Polyrhizophydium stewartii]|uniref:Emp24p/erv25p-related protein n=1 Tax=Polyrhizophydium stewartii TaxID=2732419 RepID=A0ABR4N9H0_9FUNG